MKRQRGRGECCGAAWNKCRDVRAAAKTQWQQHSPPFSSNLIKYLDRTGIIRCTHLVRAVRQRVPQGAPAGDDDRGLVVVAAGFLGVGRPGHPAGSRTQLVAVGRGGILPPHRHRHGDDEREEAVFAGPLCARALRIGGTPGPVGLLRQVETIICKCSVPLLQTPRVEEPHVRVRPAALSLSLSDASAEPLHSSPLHRVAQILPEPGGKKMSLNNPNTP